MIYRVDEKHLGKTARSMRAYLVVTEQERVQCHSVAAQGPGKQFSCSAADRISLEVEDSKRLQGKSRNVDSC